MKRLFLLGLLLLSSSSFLSLVYGQSPELNGKWVLEKAEIKQLSDNGKETNIPYTKKVYANSADCIFSMLELKDGTCTLTEDDMPEVVLKYTVDNGNMTVWFSGPIQFKFDSVSSTKYILTRQYNKFDDKAKTATKINVQLTYIKK